MLPGFHKEQAAPEKCVLLMLMLFSSGGGERCVCDFGNDTNIRPAITKNDAFQPLVGANAKDGVAPRRWQVGCKGMQLGPCREGVGQASDWTEPDGCILRGGIGRSPEWGVVSKSE